MSGPQRRQAQRWRLAARNGAGDVQRLRLLGRSLGRNVSASGRRRGWGRPVGRSISDHLDFRRRLALPRAIATRQRIGRGRRNRRRRGLGPWSLVDFARRRWRRNIQRTACHSPHPLAHANLGPVLAAPNGSQQQCCDTKPGDGRFPCHKNLHQQRRGSQCNVIASHTGCIGCDNSPGEKGCRRKGGSGWKGCSNCPAVSRFLRPSILTAGFSTGAKVSELSALHASASGGHAGT